MIVKVQRALAGTRAVLIYNEDRTVMWQETDPKGCAGLERILRGRPKAYFEAELRPDGKIEVFSKLEAPEQPW